MTWLNARAPYNSILRHIKERGVRVYHRQMKNGAGGLFDCRQVIITIDKDLRDTWEGCYVQLHEYQHFCDSREGKFRKFFETKLADTEENRALVLEAEFSAVNGAVKMLKMWGIKYEPDELSGDGRERAIKFWLEYYFGKKKCN